MTSVCSDLTIDGLVLSNLPSEVIGPVQLLVQHGHKDRILALVSSQEDSETERFVERCLEPIIEYARCHFGPGCFEPLDKRHVGRISSQDRPLWLRCLDLLGMPRGRDTNLDDPEEQHTFVTKVHHNLILAALSRAEAAEWVLGVLLDAQNSRSASWDLLSLHQQVACVRWAIGTNAEVSIRSFYSTLVELLDHHDEPPTCSICYDQSPGIVFEPCGHLCLCSGDWKRLREDHRQASASKLPKCPLCRKGIESYWKAGRAWRSTKVTKPTLKRRALPLRPGQLLAQRLLPLVRHFPLGRVELNYYETQSRLQSHHAHDLTLQGTVVFGSDTHADAPIEQRDVAV